MGASGMKMLNANLNSSNKCLIKTIKTKYNMDKLTIREIVEAKDFEIAIYYLRKKQIKKLYNNIKNLTIKNFVENDIFPARVVNKT